VPLDREEAAINDSPEVVADTMSDATDRLRDQAWMVAPLTSGAVTDAPTRSRASAQRGSGSRRLSM